MSKDKLTKEQHEELQKALDEIMKEAKDVVKDYTDNPSEISGSTIQIHEDSPFMSDKEYLKGNKWKHAIMGNPIPEKVKNKDKSAKKDKKDNKKA